MTTEKLTTLLERATAGPWLDGAKDINDQPIVRGDHYAVATCWHHCVGSIEKEAHANAQLIALAPDLVREVIALREVAEKMADALAEVSRRLPLCARNIEDEYPLWAAALDNMSNEAGEALGAHRALQEGE